MIPILFFCLQLPVGETEPSKLNAELSRLQEVLMYKHAVLQMIDKASKHLLADEVEISDAQLEKVRKFMADNDALKIEWAARKKNLPDKMRDYQAAVENVDEMLKEVFLEHQLRRIDQVILQMKIGADDFGLVSKVADELQLSAEEKKLLEKTIRQKRQEFYEKDAKLKARAADAILDSIPTKYRKQIREEIGEPFDFDRFLGAKQSNSEK